MKLFSKMLARIAGQAEVAADPGDVASLVPGGDPTVQGPRMDRLMVNGRQRQVAGQAERPTERQQEAIARLQAQRIGNVLHGKPALAGHQRIAFDAFMRMELEAPIPSNIKATAHRVAWLQERQDA
jgi:hypothetical protein